MSSPAPPRLVRALLNCLIVGGLAVACVPVAQTLYGRWSQKQLDQQWQQQSVAAVKAPVEKVRMAAPATKAQGGKAQGGKAQGGKAKAAVKIRRAKWPLTKLSIPDANLVTYVVGNWDDDSLRRGPGHGPLTALPGMGNCVIAGHRNLYGSPFYEVDQLMPGAQIVLESKLGRFVYTTSRVFSTTDSDDSILGPPAPGQPPLLTLITCTMPHTSTASSCRPRLPNSELRVRGGGAVLLLPPNSQPNQNSRSENTR